MSLLRSNAALGLGLTLLGFCGFALVVRPAHVDARALDADIELKKAELLRPGSGPEAIEKLARDLGALRALGSERMTPIPQESGVAGLVRELSESFDRLGLKDREISTGAAKVLEDASCLPMSITVQGPFPAIYEALAGIESLDRLVRVQRLRVAHDARAGGGGAATGTVNRSGRVRADIQLDVFFAPKRTGTPATEGGRP
ncbi:MAG: type 4a pilus biogenesis protein PilO [Phycisphaerales bacterium]